MFMVENDPSKMEYLQTRFHARNCFKDVQDLSGDHAETASGEHRRIPKVGLLTSFVVGFTIQTN